MEDSYTCATALAEGQSPTNTSNSSDSFHTASDGANESATFDPMTPPLSAAVGMTTGGREAVTNSNSDVCLPDPTEREMESQRNRVSTEKGMEDTALMETEAESQGTVVSMERGKGSPGSTVATEREMESMEDMVPTDGVTESLSVLDGGGAEKALPGSVRGCGLSPVLVQEVVGCLEEGGGCGQLGGGDGVKNVEGGKEVGEGEGVKEEEGEGEGERKGARLIEEVKKDKKMGISEEGEEGEEVEREGEGVREGQVVEVGVQEKVDKEEGAVEEREGGKEAFESAPRKDEGEEEDEAMEVDEGLGLETATKTLPLVTTGDDTCNHDNSTDCKSDDAPSLQLATPQAGDTGDAEPCLLNSNGSSPNPESAPDCDGASSSSSSSSSSSGFGSEAGRTDLEQASEGDTSSLPSLPPDAISRGSDRDFSSLPSVSSDAGSRATPSCSSGGDVASRETSPGGVVTDEMIVEEERLQEREAREDSVEGEVRGEVGREEVSTKLEVTW